MKTKSKGKELTEKILTIWNTRTPYIGENEYGSKEHFQIKELIVDPQTCGPLLISCSPEIASELIASLEQGRLDEETTFNIGKIEGGTVRNAVPENTLIEGEFRSHNLETIELLQSSVKAKISEFREKYPDAEITDSFRENFAAYKLTPDDSMVQLACSTMIDMGVNPTLETTGGCTDANVFNKHGIPCVVVGMGTNDMHTVREYVKIDELEEVAQFCLNLIAKK